MAGHPPTPARQSHAPAPRARDALAIVIARTAGRLTRMGGFSGTSLPGLVAERVAPGIAGRLSSDLGPIALVSGTNGKTTTSLTLATVLRRSGHRVTTNPSGANLGQAVASVLVGRADLTGDGLRRGGDHGVFEVDEAALPTLLDELPVRALLLTNLFRDQLDRFGETDRIVRIWRPMLERHSDVPVVFCADDPRLAALVRDRANARGYGFAEKPSAATDGDAVTTDVTTCPVCAAPLRVAWTTIAHLGDYRCDSCGFGRPAPWLSVRVVDDRGFDGQTLGFGWSASGQEATASVGLIGIANAYNAAGAVAAATLLGVDPTEAVGALDGVGPAFGRWETLEMDGRRVVLSLVKNPASLDEVTRAGTSAHVDAVLFSMNDQHADGRDVSWYWDVDPTPLVPGRLVAIAGARGPDMLLRLRYQLLDAPDADLPGFVGLFERPSSGLDALVARVSAGGTVLVVSTYTALLGLRAELVLRGLLAPMPT